MKNPIGRPKKNTVQYKRRIEPELVPKMDTFLNQLKAEYEKEKANKK